MLFWAESLLTACRVQSRMSMDSSALLSAVPLSSPGRTRSGSVRVSRAVPVIRSLTESAQP